MANPALETPPRDPKTGKFQPGGSAAVQEPPPKPSLEKAEAEQAGLKTFYKQHFKKEPKAEVPPEKKEETPPEKKVPEAKVQPRRRAPQQPPPAAQSSAQDIAKAVGDAVREVIQPKPAKKDEKQADIDEGLGDDEKETVVVLREMGEMAPDKYKGLAEKYAAGQRELNAYVKKWQKEHKGEEFNIEDQEHADFVEEHNPDWSDTDFERAKRNLLKKEVREEVKKEIAPKLTEIEERDRLREATPAIHGEVMDAARKFWGQMPDEYKGVIKADGSIDDEVLGKMQQADPDAYEQMMRTASDLNYEISELRKLFPLAEDKPALVKFNPANPVHKAIDEFGVQLEGDILSNPPGSRLNQDGKEFMPSDKYFALPKAERRDFWTLTFPDVREALILDRAERVKLALKTIEEKFLRRAKSRNMVQNGSPSAGAASQQPLRQPPANRNEREVKPDGPGSQSTSKMAATLRSSANEGKDASSSFLKHHFPRKL